MFYFVLILSLNMANFLTEDLTRSLIARATIPLVFRNFVSNWKISQWNEEKWCTIFCDKTIPFRCLRRNFVSDEPCWERRCAVKSLTFKDFLQTVNDEEWMYFDYKYLHHWFPNESELCKELCWKQFGYPEKGAADTTLWVGSKGAHTPCHQDTYGFNIVSQLYGRKRWILFPPETGGLKPTRVPYEESSVYSELNFYCPDNLDSFKGLTGARVVELSSGDALFVPRGWWHYVQNVDPLNIAVNIWLPHEKDTSAQVSEALIKILVAQLCKDLPQETAKLLVNPNEDDISDTPLAVLFLQLETVAKAYLDKKRKVHRLKRQKKREENVDSQDAGAEGLDLKSFIDNPQNNLEVVPNISNEKLIEMLSDNLKEFTAAEKKTQEGHAEGAAGGLRLTKAVIDSFSETDVVELIKENLFKRLSNM